MNLAMSRELRAEKSAHPGLTVQEIAKQTGVPVGTLNRVFAKDASQVRDINVTVIAALAKVFDMTPAELVQRAERRAKRMAARMSVESSTTNVIDFEQRRLRGEEDTAADDFDPGADAPED